MRLKRAFRPQEETFLVQQRNLNKQYGDKLSSIRQPPEKNASQERIGTHQGWNPFPGSLSRNGSDSATNANYSPALASPLEDGSDQAMSLSSPEDNSRNATSEEDSLSDLEYNETSPLLAVSSYGEEGSTSDDCNNNSGDRDLFSDSSDMSEPPKDCFSLENSFNNNNNFLENQHGQNQLFSAPSDKKFSFGSDRKHSKQEGVSPVHRDSRSSERVMVPFQVQKTNLPDVLPLEVATSPSAASPDINDVSPMSDTTPSKELNINMATQAFNNFSMPTSKHSDIQCLVQDKDTEGGVNIRETQPQCLPDCLVEPKILNTGDSLPKNMTKEYQHQLRNKGDRNSWDASNKHPDHQNNDSRKSDCVIFDSSCHVTNRNVDSKSYLSSRGRGSVLEYFARDNRLQGVFDKSSEGGEGCRKRDSSSASGGIKDLFKIMDIPLSHMSPRVTSSKTDKQEQEDLTGPANMAHSNSAQQWSGHVQAASGEVRKAATTTSIKEKTPPLSGSAIDENCNKSGVTSESSRKSSDTVRSSLNKDPSPELLGDFDVFNIETAMPTIDWAAMEAHLTRAAKEDDWLLRRQNDREEIRRKLAMDSDNEEYYCGERVTRKPSLTTRLQSGMNLQICFMNETASDQESQGSDHDTESMTNDGNNAQQSETKVEQPEPANDVDKNLNKTPDVSTNINNNEEDTRLQSSGTKRQRPSFFFNRQRSWRLGHLCTPQQKKAEGEKGMPEEDFYTRHARLQAEARLALAQAKDMARMQMEVEKQRKKKSPIAEIVGLPFPDGRHRLSRQVLTDMNVAQLQVIVNDLHSQIESLNEDLVRLLLERDDLHMEQDSMLVDIEDLTRYLGAKDEALRNQQNVQLKKLKSCKK